MAAPFASLSSGALLRMAEFTSGSERDILPRPVDIDRRSELASFRFMLATSEGEMR